MTEPRGRPPHPDVLTPAEWQVLNLVRHGLPNRRIAELRATSVDAVKFHVANILSKLDADDRATLRDWPGKTTSVNELKTRITAQLARKIGID